MRVKPPSSQPDFSRIVRPILILSGMLCLPDALPAQPVPWSHPDGTMHYYDAIERPAGIDWADAVAEAASVRGYLVTLTSLDENDFVFSWVDTLSYWFERADGSFAGPWTGGFQPPGSTEPDGNWQWVTGEPFDFSNWSSGEPNDGGGEDRIHFGEVAGDRVPTWDDLDGNDPDLRGYLLELSAPVQTVGLFLHDPASYDGYTLFAPIQATTTYLIDNLGRQVHAWENPYPPGQSVYLLEDGSLLRTASLGPGGNPTFHGGGAGGRIERIAWDGSVEWDFVYSSPEVLQHHDVAYLPNGNVLAIAWEFKTAAEAIAAGRDPSLLIDGELWPDHVVEVAPRGADEGEIVWEWHAWDHLIQDFDPTKENYGAVAEHPGRIDLNFAPDPKADWLHLNAVDYNESLDQIVLSTPRLSEVWVIDHSTTTEEAAGESGGNCGSGGAILYRWGNPRTYRAGDPEDRNLYGQHDVHWIDSGLPGAGHLLVFNNGRNRPGGNASSVDEIETTVDQSGCYPQPPPGTPHGPADALWSYAPAPPNDFYSALVSGAQRQPNGNTLICDGPHGNLFEVDSDGTILWRYVNPVVSDGAMRQGDSIPQENPDALENILFRCYRYGPDSAGLAGQDLTPGYPIETYSFVPTDALDSFQPLLVSGLMQNRPNPFTPTTLIPYQLDFLETIDLAVYDVSGRLIRTLVQGTIQAGLHQVEWDGKNDRGNDVAPGVYFYHLASESSRESRAMLKLD